MRLRPELLRGALVYYEDHPKEFINHWVDTFDPRNVAKGKSSRMPLIMFERQGEFIDFLMQMIENESDGLIEKCRDMGATWVCAAFSVWLWRFKAGTSVGWGSRKQDLVDRLGVPDSIFEKLRIIINKMPKEFLPQGFSTKDHLTFMKVINPDNGSIISGEAGDNIGRGGRNLIYFKDESAHYERPELIEASLGDNTRCQIDISSVNGTGNVFHRKRMAGQEWSGQVKDPHQTQVFIMDWSDHPEKTEEWYQKRKAKAEAQGLKHVFAQEVDRDYSSSVEGVIIRPEWVEAAVDAHIKLGIKPTGRRVFGLDVADEGLDKDALVGRKGILVDFCSTFRGKDVGETTRDAVDFLESFDQADVMYDSIGIGAGVKAEVNRLIKNGQLDDKLIFNSWAASAKVQDPDQHLIEDDTKTPTNADYYQNLKAQAWGRAAQRFFKTYQAVVEGLEVDPDDIVSLCSEMDELETLKRELSQAVRKISHVTGKIVVDKSPTGTKSPNAADGCIMSLNPVYDSGPKVMMFARST